MEQKPTLQQKLAARKLKSPPAFLYRILVFVLRVLFEKKLNITIGRDVDLAAYKGPYIVVGNHASRLDYIYAALAFYPHTLNFVAGYNEFFRSHLAFVFRLMQVVPKRNFVPDTYTIREVTRVLNGGGRVALFPEGMSSISGANQPCAIGSGKFLKHFRLPVLMMKISGGYLTNTKYCLDERPGQVDVTVSEFLSPEQIARMSAEEIQAKLDMELYHDDYDWNKQARVEFAAGGRIAHNLHTLLFWCPKCHKEFSMYAEGSTIQCMACGNGAMMNEYYDLIPLDEDCVIPDTPREWFDLQRRHVYLAVKEAGFVLKEKVQLGVLPKLEYLKKQATSVIVGGGELTLDHSGFSFSGIKEGEPFSFHIDPQQLPTFGMCTDVSRFYTFVENEFYEFFPETQSVEKWFMAAEELHRLMGGQWRNFPDAIIYAD